jgi:hypothetical protein
MVGKSLKLCSCKKIKIFAAKYYANKQEWMITTIFTVFNLLAPELNACSDLQKNRIQMQAAEECCLRADNAQCFEHHTACYTRITFGTKSLRALDTSMGVHGRNTICGQQCCSFTGNITSVSVRVVYFPPVCTCMLQPLDLSIKMFQSSCLGSTKH